MTTPARVPLHAPQTPGRIPAPFAARPRVFGLPGAPWRSVAAWLLRTCSRLLGRAARRLRHGERPCAAPELEFYAEAGAPEGALYANGCLVGRLEGVTRL